MKIDVFKDDLKAHKDCYIARTDIYLTENMKMSIVTSKDMIDGIIKTKVDASKKRIRPQTGDFGLVHILGEDYDKVIINTITSKNASKENIKAVHKKSLENVEAIKKAIMTYYA